MRLTTKKFATAACAICFVSAFSLCAEEAAKPSAGISGDSASTANVISVAELSDGTPSAPIPSSSMGAASPYSAGMNMGTPKVELFLGYSYLRAVPTMADGNRLVWMNGGSTSIALNFNRHLGLVADFGAYTNSQIRFTGGYTSTVDVNNSNVAALTYLIGPRLSFRRNEKITPFVQALFGGVHANQVTLTDCTFSCTLLPSQDAFAMTAGGGLDLRVRHHIAIRIIQAEYLMTRFASYTTGATAMQNDMRLSSGLVLRFGGSPHFAELPSVTYSCFVNPASVNVGTAIAVSGSAINLDPAKTAVYTWLVDGGTVSGTSGSATIDTSNAAPGSYTLKGHVSAGDKAGENADCRAPYVVKAVEVVQAIEPPTISCTADPSVVISGNPSTITATGVSTQNRPLTYSFSSNSGSVSGTGSTATLTTTGAPTGVMTVTCNVVDDKAQTASSTTSVTVEAPVAAPKPTTSEQCSVQFERDARRPARVDNEAKACLDEVAMTLQRSSDASLAIVGNADSNEKDSQKLASERAVNTKAYLVGDKGIDSSRIKVYTGSQNGKIVSIVLIPADATFAATGDTAIE
jgi:outer membrane protein OmpA-like peptidoglycan-associated protein